RDRNVTGVQTCALPISSGHDDQGDGGRHGLENLERRHPAKPRHRIVGEHDIRPELPQRAAKGVGFIDALRLAVERCAAELAYSRSEEPRLNSSHVSISY